MVADDFDCDANKKLPVLLIRHFLGAAPASCCLLLSSQQMGLRDADVHVERVMQRENCEPRPRSEVELKVDMHPTGDLRPCPDQLGSPCCAEEQPAPDGRVGKLGQRSVAMARRPELAVRVERHCGQRTLYELRGQQFRVDLMLHPIAAHKRPAAGITPAVGVVRGGARCELTAGARGTVSSSADVGRRAASKGAVVHRAQVGAALEAEEAVRAPVRRPGVGDQPVVESGRGVGAPPNNLDAVPADLLGSIRGVV